MTPATSLILLGLLASVALAAGGWVLFASRRRPQDQERARRLLLSTRGRIAEAQVTGIDGMIAGFTYEIGGVNYQAVQDLSAVWDRLPKDSSLLLGPASIRYSTSNPANSILMSESWSGLRVAPVSISEP